MLIGDRDSILNRPGGEWRVEGHIRCQGRASEARCYTRSRVHKKATREKAQLNQLPVITPAHNKTYICTHLYPINLEFERERNSIDGDKFNFTRVHQDLTTFFRWGIE